MAQKDYSLSKKKGWQEYQDTSYMLPFKFFGSGQMSALIYALTIGGGLACYKNGGIEATVKLLLPFIVK